MATAACLAGAVTKTTCCSGCGGILLTGTCGGWRSPCAAAARSSADVYGSPHSERRYVREIVIIAIPSRITCSMSILNLCGFVFGLIGLATRYRRLLLLS